MKTLIAIVAVLVILGGTVVGSYVTNANYGNRAEVSIDKEYENLQNILSKYTNLIAEAAQVPTMMKDDMKDVMTSVMVARQGPSGSKAMFQWFKEHQINLSPELYINIQDMMKAGRQEFQNSQTRFIDVKAVYVTNLGYLWKGMWLKMADYPQINVGYPRGTVDDYPIVKSAAAVASFATGIDSVIKLR